MTCGDYTLVVTTTSVHLLGEKTLQWGAGGDFFKRGICHFPT
jgi:hypothetical protein